MKAGCIRAWVAGVLLANASAAELRVAAAASLAESIAEIATTYQKANRTRVTPVIGGSNVLARQIENGAPLDVFISADNATMSRLAKAGLVRDVAPLLTNALVVVVPTDSTASIRSAADLANLGRIAIGDPMAVPAGIYARKWLETKELWETLKPKCIGAENVRAALAVVESANVDAAIVYRTDAAVSTKSRIVWTVPADESPQIVYPVACCATTGDPGEAARFIAFLRSPAVADIFKAHGFGLAAP
ncbi:molybdate ABC transporter substrate-binding protein [Luteolibacter marinus]|uniref:molybdate ABC transporter substrate-binding protein n=1 Tax=Luteolibacter marinus TaxID=2776705 RepID=UPI001866EF4C|nr:molybdate ABC transporter substrate-binding protein [Luteolibacter marinus]